MKEPKTLYTSIYTQNIPVLLQQLANTSEMRRLADIGMHCGCEYASFPLYRKARNPYTRLIHSVGVSKIVWNFTHDIRQSVAGLLHDIATPVFAHTIDFLRGDHLLQESTEDKTLVFIESSKEIAALLKKHQICIEDISDYHKYPVADNDTPMLSADRLEYTIGTGFCLFNMELEILNGIYKDLRVAENEHGTEEICFQSIEAARKFAEISLRNSRSFVSDEDRFSMQYLADILRFAIDNGVLLPEDLYSTEIEVINKLHQDIELSKMWRSYTEISAVAASAEKSSHRYCVNVSAKKRYIDPLVLEKNNVKRLSEADGEIRRQIQTFLHMDFNKWMFAVYSAYHPQTSCKELLEESHKGECSCEFT